MLRISGITPLTVVPREGWVNWLAANFSQLTTLSAGQTVDAQIAPAKPSARRTLVCVPDPSMEQFRSYRPSKFSMTGSIGMTDLDGNAQVRSFSFSDVPLQVVAR